MKPVNILINNDDIHGYGFFYDTDDMTVLQHMQIEQAKFIMKDEEEDKDNKQISPNKSYRIPISHPVSFFIGCVIKEPMKYAIICVISSFAGVAFYTLMHPI